MADHVTRIGKNQLCMLITLASPTMLLLTPGKAEAAMVRRGLLREREPGGALAITPAGLRALADEMEAGRVDDAMARMRKDVAERRARIAAKQRGNR
jgi:hypothetical protein